MEFKDEQQAYECLKEWQTRLFLDDWIIMIDFAENPTLNDDECGAVVEQYASLKNACIIFRKPYKLDDGCVSIEKICQEKDMLHELLHLKIIRLDNPFGIEAILFDTYQHQIVEQLAKSLLMAKYSLNFDWFKNF